MLDRFRRPAASLPRRFALAGLALGLLLGGVAVPPAAALPGPSPMQAGSNSGSADSLIGVGQWYFQATKGPFTVTINSTTTSQDSAPLGGGFSVRVAFSPNVKGDRFTSTPTQGGLVIHGTAVKATKVLIIIVPPNSPLVRVARNYVIQATGAVAFAHATGGDPIVGPYISRNGYGATRFNANGTLVTADGQQGTWVLFDSGLRIYTVTIGTNKMTCKLVGGRGLIDASNENLYFESAR